MPEQVLMPRLVMTRAELQNIANYCDRARWHSSAMIRSKAWIGMSSLVASSSISSSPAAKIASRPKRLMVIRWMVLM